MVSLENRGVNHAWRPDASTALRSAQHDSEGSGKFLLLSELVFIRVNSWLTQDSIGETSGSH